MEIKEGQSLGFLRAGGEMGELVRTKNWSKTPLGIPELWPQSLRTSVSILLNSQFPMFIWWGPELITIYNDAYRLIAGEKHPKALGEKGSVVWSEIWSIIGPLAEQVMQEGVSTWAEDQKLDINRRGYIEESYFTFSYSPVFDESGGIGGVFCTCTETTAKVVAAKRLQESEQSFRNLVTEAPVAICLLNGPDFVVEVANERMLDFLGRTSKIIGRPILEALPEANSQGLIQILEKVQRTQEPYYVSTFPATLLINGIKENRFFDLVFKPHDKPGFETEVASIFCVAHNVTEQVLVQKKLEENESELQKRVAQRTADLEQQKVFISSILDASFNGIYALKAVRNKEGKIIDFQFLFANNNIAKLVKLNVEEIIGTSMLNLLPQNKTNGFFDLFCSVLQTQQAIHDVTYFVADDINNWFDYVVVPIDSETVVVTTQDITEQKLAAVQIEQQRNLLDNIMEHSPSAITVTQMIRNEEGEIIDGKTIVANSISEKYMGVHLNQLLGSKVSDLDPHLIDSPLFQMALHILTTGESQTVQYLFEPTQRWLELSIAKMDDDCLINVFTDITTTKKAQLEIVQSVERLAAVFNAAQSGMFIFSPVYSGSEIVDFRFVITNANFAAYVGQTPEVLNGALGSTWFPGYLENGVFDMYKTTFVTGETQRKDIHYSVDGHNLYLDLMSTKVGEEVLITFTDHTQLKTVQFQLENHIEELKRSNGNLEEFAHAASHDLKEPVRKVQIFSDRLKNSFDILSEEQQNLFGRVQDATKRMSLLIDDLLDYSHVSMGVDLLEQIDLNKKLRAVLEDLEVAIQEKNATFSIGNMPVVKGHRRQLQQLFHNLVQNALKYSKDDVAPHIIITSETVTGSDSTFDLPAEKRTALYHLILVKDNGIGFEQQHAERIFQMFQRLHGKSEYKGTGVGLAIVRKVVENHNGYIAAESKLGEGATFKILLPAD